MATRDTYTKVHEDWKDKPNKTTPVWAEDLEHIEQGIKDAADKRALKEIYDDNAINFGRKVGTSSGSRSAAFGNQNTASGSRSTVTGYRNTAGGDDSLVEGGENIILGTYGHGEGYGNKNSARSYAIHMEGGSNIAEDGSYLHLEGYGNKATGGSYIHLEGANNEMLNSGTSSAHLEGQGNRSSGSYSHNEGGYNVLFGNYSHLEGYDNTEQEGASVNHIEGNYNKVLSGMYNHVGGNGNTANGTGLHVSGLNNKGVGQYQSVWGKYNEENENAVFIVGGGTSDSDRKNIHTIDRAGNGYFAGDVKNGAGVSLNSLKSAIDNLQTGGGVTAKVFDTKADLDTWLAVEGNAETLSVSQNIYIKETGTPDYWWDGTGLQILETDKIVIESMTYDEAMAILNATAEEVA